MMAKHTMTQLIAAGALKDQTLREYVDHKLADGLMTAVQIEARFGESIISMGPIIESQIKGQNLVRIEQSVNITPLVRCKNCKHYNAGFECLIEGYGIERPADYFCADGKRKDGGKDNV